jgi:hypothetical protein
MSRLQRVAPKKVTKGAPIDEGFDGNKFFGHYVKDLRRSKTNSILGYLAMDVVRPPDGAMWGKFNNRALDEGWVDTMAESFAANMDNCANDHSMEIALDPDWLENAEQILKSVDGLTIEQVPIIKFNAKGKIAIKEDNLWVLGGNHRRMAVLKYMKIMEAESEKTKQSIAKAKEGKTEDDIAKLYAEDEGMLKWSEERVKVLEAKMETSRLWSVRVYDRGACSERGYTGGEANAASS